MRLTLIERKSLTKVFARKYEFATKREKKVIIDEFVEYTGFNRSYATRALRNALMAKVKPVRLPKRKRRSYYDEAVVMALRTTWEISDYLCGKRLVALLPDLIPKLEEFQEIEIADVTRARLLEISAATIDRLLRPAKRKLGRKGTSMTKSGKYLIDQIPIKTFGEWQDSPAGFIQIDLAAHNGGNVFGGFMHTLTSTDVCTTWTNCTLVKDKTKPQMVRGLFAMKNAFPFELKGMHSDNGAEFINDLVHKFATKHNLEFTRGRPYKKNDNAHIEQKNYSVLRRNTGYLRYDQPDHAKILKELYGYLNLFVNFFQPTMVLLQKHRVGAKAYRQYDEPKTPFKRVLARQDIPRSIKTELKALYKTLNPAELKRKINDCQSRLIKAAAPIRVPLKPKKIRRNKQIKHTLPVGRRESNPANANPFLERQRIEEMKRAAQTIDDERRENS